MNNEQHIPDELNPRYIFSSTRNALLIDILSGKVNPQELAARELANRGYDHYGKFVGFGRAEEILNEWLEEA